MFPEQMSITLSSLRCVIDRMLLQLKQYRLYFNCNSLWRTSTVCELSICCLFSLQVKYKCNKDGSIKIGMRRCILTLSMWLIWMACCVQAARSDLRKTEGPND